jgi:dipeptidyl-peptidase-4
VKAAANLHGKLLILHGLIDDNVHIQNTMQLVQALQAADKDFELMVYPRSRHGIGGAHYQRLQLEFMERALGLPVTPPAPRPEGGRGGGRRQPPGP